MTAGTVGLPPIAQATELTLSARGEVGLGSDRSPTDRSTVIGSWSRRRRPPRHPAEVTADRLGDHLDRWFDTTNGELRDAIAKVRDWLDQRSESAL